MKAIGHVWRTETLDPCPSCAMDGIRSNLVVENTVKHGASVSTRVRCPSWRCAKLFSESTTDSQAVTEPAALSAIRWRFRRDRMIYALAALIAMLTSAGIALAK